jgi:hypothetical protein
MNGFVVVSRWFAGLVGRIKSQDWLTKTRPLPFSYRPWITWSGLEQSGGIRYPTNLQAITGTVSRCL